MAAAETEARQRLAEAERAGNPAQTLALALAAAEAALRNGAPPDGQSLAVLAQAALGQGLDKRDAAQLVRLASVAQRAQAGETVDPLDAELALALARRLAQTSPLSGAETSPPSPPLAREGGQIPPPSFAGKGDGGLDSAQPPSPPVIIKAGTGVLAPRPVARGAPHPSPLTVGEGARAERLSILGNAAGFMLWAIVTLLLATLGPLMLSLLGPAWIRWLVWPVALATGWLALRSLLKLAAHHVGLALVTALGVSVALGVGWALAAETGWMPPLNYVVNAPLPSLSGLRPAPGATLHVGGRARVQGTQGTGLRVRTRPGVNADELTRLPDGTTVRLVAGPQFADGFTWWQAEGNGAVGWVADEWLQPLD